MHQSVLLGLNIFNVKDNNINMSTHRGELSQSNLGAAMVHLTDFTHNNVFSTFFIFGHLCLLLISAYSVHLGVGGNLILLLILFLRLLLLEGHHLGVRVVRGARERLLLVLFWCPLLHVASHARGV